MFDNNKIRLAFYGDDFTGSTDALEFLSLSGAKTVLFLKAPDPEQLKQYDGLDAIGVAGTTRSMASEDMEHALQPAFEGLKKLKPRHIHYKVCSTFDSSPQIGSIGKAIDIGSQIFQTEFIPLLVAAPSLGRYSVFGNLFAQMGIGSAGEIFRLDRHPSMSVHPVTPARESDLRLHLAEQTSKSLGLFDLLDLELPFDRARQKIGDMIKKGKEVIFFDAAYEHQMLFIGSLIDSFAGKGKSLFSVGSSGIEKALGDYWKQKGGFQNKTEWPDPDKKGPILIVSGSCSPVTATQISWAVSQGFAEVAIGEEALKVRENNHSLIEKYVPEIVSRLKDNKSVIVHTCLGPEDPRIQQINDFYRSSGLNRLDAGSQTARDFGKILGRIILKTLETTRLRRIVIAGGDTSGYTASELGIESFEMIAPIVKGAPLCRAFAPGSLTNGLEINFKGGQVGDERYFEHVLNGKK